MPKGDLLRSATERHELDYSLSTARLTADVTTIHDDPEDGGDTEARVLIRGANGRTYYGEGFAFLAPGDHYDRGTGTQLAVNRALVSALQDMEYDIIDQTQTEDAFRAEQRNQTAPETARRLDGFFADIDRFLAQTRKEGRKVVIEKCDDQFCPCTYVAE